MQSCSVLFACESINLSTICVKRESVSYKKYILPLKLSQDNKTANISSNVYHCILELLNTVKIIICFNIPRF